MACPLLAECCFCQRGITEAGLEKIDELHIIVNTLLKTQGAGPIKEEHPRPILLCQGQETLPSRYLLQPDWRSGGQLCHCTQNGDGMARLGSLGMSTTIGKRGSRLPTSPGMALMSLNSWLRSFQFSARSFLWLSKVFSPAATLECIILESRLIRRTPFVEQALQAGCEALLHHWLCAC